MAHGFRPRKKLPRWVSAAVGAAPDPRIDADSPDYGKRSVHRLVLVDSVGRAVEFRDFKEPVVLPPPPPLNDPKRDPDQGT